MNGSHNYCSNLEFKIPCIPNYFPKRKRNLFNEFKKVEIPNEINNNYNSNMNSKSNTDSYANDIYWSTSTLPMSSDKLNDSIDCDWNRKSLNSSIENDDLNNFISKLNCIDEIIDNVKRISVNEINSNNIISDSNVNHNNNNEQEIIDCCQDDDWEDDDDFVQLFSQIANVSDGNSNRFVAVDEDGFVSKSLINGNLNVPIPKMSSPIIKKSTQRNISSHFFENSPITRKQPKIDTSLSSNDTFDNSDDDRLLANFDVNKIENSNTVTEEKSLMDIVNDSSFELSSDVVYLDSNSLFTSKATFQKNESDSDSFEWDEEGDFLCSQI